MGLFQYILIIPFMLLFFGREHIQLQFKLIKDVYLGLKEPRVEEVILLYFGMVCMEDRGLAGCRACMAGKASFEYMGCMDLNHTLIQKWNYPYNYYYTFHPGSCRIKCQVN